MSKVTELIKAVLYMQSNYDNVGSETITFLENKINGQTLIISRKSCYGT